MRHLTADEVSHQIREAVFRIRVIKKILTGLGVAQRQMDMISAAAVGLPINVK